MNNYSASSSPSTTTTSDILASSSSSHRPNQCNSDHQSFDHNNPMNNTLSIMMVVDPSHPHDHRNQIQIEIQNQNHHYHHDHLNDDDLIGPNGLLIDSGNCSLNSFSPSSLCGTTTTIGNGATIFAPNSSSASSSVSSNSNHQQLTLTSALAMNSNQTLANSSEAVSDAEELFLTDHLSYSIPSKSCSAIDEDIAVNDDDVDDGIDGGIDGDEEEDDDYDYDIDYQDHNQQHKQVMLIDGEDGIDSIPHHFNDHYHHNLMLDNFFDTAYGDHGWENELITTAMMINTTSPPSTPTLGGAGNLVFGVSTDASNTLTLPTLLSSSTKTQCNKIQTSLRTQIMKKNSCNNKTKTTNKATTTTNFSNNDNNYCLSSPSSPTTMSCQSNQLKLSSSKGSSSKNNKRNCSVTTSTNNSKKRSITSKKNNSGNKRRLLINNNNNNKSLDHHQQLASLSPFSSSCYSPSASASVSPSPSPSSSSSSSDHQQVSSSSCLSTRMVNNYDNNSHLKNNLQFSSPITTTTTRLNNSRKKNINENLNISDASSTMSYYNNNSSNNFVDEHDDDDDDDFLDENNTIIVSPLTLAPLPPPPQIPQKVQEEQEGLSVVAAPVIHGSTRVPRNQAGPGVPPTRNSRIIDTEITDEERRLLCKEGKCVCVVWMFCAAFTICKYLFV